MAERFNPKATLAQSIRSVRFKRCAKLHPLLAVYRSPVLCNHGVNTTRSRYSFSIRLFSRAHVTCWPVACCVE